jgi:hypothetical protein
MTDQLAESREPLSIIELRAQNVMRLRVARIRFDPAQNVFVVSGRNGQGKSSVLLAVAMALGGKDFVPPMPVHRGESWGEIVLDLGKYVVRRSFLSNGTTSLVVTQGKEGPKIASPQGLLDSFVGDLTFDPLSFSRMKPAEQAELLRKLAGLDFGAANNLRQIAYEQRTEFNRDVAKLTARLGAMPEHTDAPAAAVDVAEIAGRLSAAQATNAANVALRDSVKALGTYIAHDQTLILRLREELAAAEERCADRQQELKQKQQQIADARDVDLVPLRTELLCAEDTNRKVRENGNRLRIAAELDDARRGSNERTAAIETIDESKVQAIAAARMPVNGLGFTADGTVMLNGFPLEQASGAEQLRVSVAVGIAKNPRLRVMLVRDGSLLDQDSMRLLGDLARENGAQLIVERVEIDGHTSVVIEDGEVAELPDSETVATTGTGPA